MVDNKIERVWSKSTFPPIFLLVGLLIAFVGVYYVIGLNGQQSTAGGCVGLFIAGTILLTREGMFVDSKNGRFKLYSSFWGLKKGKWITVENRFTDIAILSTNVSHNMSYKGVLPSTFTTSGYKIVLLSKKHTNKLQIFNTTDLETAKQKIELIAQLLNLKEATYQPPKVKRRR